MKTFIASILILGSSFFSQAADDGIHEKFKGEQGVFALSFSKTMIDFLDLDVEWNDQMKYVEGDFHRINLMTLSEKVQPRKAELLKELEKGSYNEIDLEDDDPGLRVFVVRKGRQIKEVHFLSQKTSDEEQVFLLSMYGDIKVSNKKDN